jgi:hypothetical protein
MFHLPATAPASSAILACSCDINIGVTVSFAFRRKCVPQEMRSAGISVLNSKLVNTVPLNLFNGAAFVWVVFSKIL